MLRPGHNPAERVTTTHAANTNSTIAIDINKNDINASGNNNNSSSSSSSSTHDMANGPHGINNKLFVDSTSQPKPSHGLHCSAAPPETRGTLQQQVTPPNHTPAPMHPPVTPPARSVLPRPASALALQRLQPIIQPQRHCQTPVTSSKIEDSVPVATVAKAGALPVVAVTAAAETAATAAAAASLPLQAVSPAETATTAASRRGRRPTSWTPEEDARLADLVAAETHMPPSMTSSKTWSIIASQLQSRTGKQCRERWLNQLKPGIKREPWSDEEEQVLYNAHARLGNRWVAIAELLPGRTDNCIKNHYNSMLRKQQRRRASAVLMERFDTSESTPRQLKPAPVLPPQFPQQQSQRSLPPSSRLNSPPGSVQSPDSSRHVSPYGVRRGPGRFNTAAVTLPTPRAYTTRDAKLEISHVMSDVLPPAVCGNHRSSPTFAMSTPVTNERRPSLRSCVDSAEPHRYRQSHRRSPLSKETCEGVGSGLLDALSDSRMTTPAPMDDGSAAPVERTLSLLTPSRVCHGNQRTEWPGQPSSMDVARHDSDHKLPEPCAVGEDNDGDLAVEHPMTGQIQLEADIQQGGRQERPSQTVDGHCQRDRYASSTRGALNSRMHRTLRRQTACQESAGGTDNNVEGETHISPGVATRGILKRRLNSNTAALAALAMAASVVPPSPLTPESRLSYSSRSRSGSTSPVAQTSPLLQLHQRPSSRQQHHRRHPDRERESKPQQLEQRLPPCRQLESQPQDLQPPSQGCQRRQHGVLVPEQNLQKREQQPRQPGQEEQQFGIEHTQWERQASLWPQVPFKQQPNQQTCFSPSREEHCRLPSVSWKQEGTHRGLPAAQEALDTPQGAYPSPQQRQAPISPSCQQHPCDGDGERATRSYRNQSLPFRRIQKGQGDGRHGIPRCFGGASNSPSGMEEVVQGSSVHASHDERMEHDDGPSPGRALEVHSRSEAMRNPEVIP
jgi:Myb-like DNA-binding domain